MQLLREPRGEPAAACLRERARPNAGSSATSTIPRARSRESTSAKRSWSGSRRRNRSESPVLGAEESVIRPEISSRPLIYKEGQVHLRPLGAPAERDDAPGLPRVDYDVPHEKPWGFDMASMLLTKGIAAGALFLSAMLWWLGWRDPITNVVGPAIAVVFGTVTAVVLIADLERPERFYYILIRPNWRSWMVWGAYF